MLKKIVEKLVLEEDDMLNDVRNQYLVIIELLNKEQEEMLVQEERFEREKDDLLDKIVKLNNTIEDYKLEMEKVKK